MIQPIATLKNWFRTGLKPTQQQFWDWLDSYWHKSEAIPSGSVQGLDALEIRVSNLEGFQSVVNLSTSSASLTYQIPAGRLLEKFLIKSTSALDFQVSLSPGANDVPVGTTVDANQVAVCYTDLFADGATRNVYFENLVGNVIILIYLR